MNYLMGVYLLIAVICGWIFWMFFRYLRYWKMINMFPRPTGNFLLGNVLDFTPSTDRAFLGFRKYNKMFPNCYSVRIGFYGTIHINTPDNAQVILSNTKLLKKSLVYDFIKPWLNSGLLTNSGSNYQERRKILTPAFHFNILKIFVKIFTKHTDEFINDLEKECLKEKTNLVPLFSKLALNIVCETALSTTLSESKDKEKYFEAVTGFGTTVVKRVMRPWLYLDPMFYLSQLAREQFGYVRTLHEFSTSVIEERDRNFNPDDYTDEGNGSKRLLGLLDLLLLTKKNTGLIDNIGIREEVDTFTFEGHDTTAMGSSFALLLLANNKDVQDKVVKELDTIFEGSNRSATYEDLQRMNYLEMCLKETLRLFPGVPFIARFVDEDIKLRDKYIIPGGTNVVIHVFDVNRNETAFPDPEKFDPERFTPEAVKNRHPYAYIPFSAGPRNCIGQKYGLLALKTIISTILRNYEVECVDKQCDIKLAMEITLRAPNGIHVKFKPRKQLNSFIK